MKGLLATGLNCAFYEILSYDFFRKVHHSRKDFTLKCDSISILAATPKLAVKGVSRSFQLALDVYINILSCMN